MVKLILFTILVVYLAGIWKFIKGYSHTNFSRQLPNKLILSLLWPVLIFFDTSYRHNFQKALKGRE
ncbi:MAG: hypothetical protein ACTMUB_05280 [cyanobacterium endosymbiont of Rhopalodia musculus]|uniref:hypothetical protein n=1 Tax=cyanobacterium endosymbiont of Epithemia clementina EcSB TaxID=3034674 RepID=UPI002480695B|nr:hypothetical protein [cyanobacterium endosymbiont of Epithemia clementina EcSB]WGT67561.1 hypothetical protein P3F56_00140 [cyanobacterium endosymbiont of Epithemia clementina EcSB]